MDTVKCPECRREFFDWDDYIEHVQAHEAIKAVEEMR